MSPARKVLNSALIRGREGLNGRCSAADPRPRHEAFPTYDKVNCLSIRQLLTSIQLFTTGLALMPLPLVIQYCDKT